ncbi:MAG: DoxX family protein [Planctomycetota bacterium]
MNVLDRLLPRTSPDLGLLALRVMLAAVFLFHGSQKLFGWFGGYGLSATIDWMGSIGIPAPAVSGTLAALTEFGGGLALLTGVLFRPMMLPLAFTMSVAAFVGHGGKGFDVQQGGMEYPLTLMVAAASLFLTGPGRFALGATPAPTRRAQEAHAS